MPIVGLEMPDGRKVRFEELDKKDVLYPVFQAMQRYANREHHRISVTRLVDCLRRSYALEYDEVYVPPQRYLRMMYGTAMHTILGAMEVPVAWETPDGITVYGSIDYLTEERLIDFKTVRSLPGQTMKNHALQINLYHFLLRHNTIGEQRNVPRLNVVYVDMEGNWESHRVRIKDHDYLHDFIRKRAKILHDALEKRIPPPEENDWLCRHCFVRKNCLWWF
jgi:CRISPR/Cas system-associated exonuclease Cas4 (RecB family)